MQAAKKRETQKKRDAAMGKVPVEDLPKVDYSEEREAPPTIAEWLDDNSRILFAVIASLVAIIVFAFIIFTQLSTKSAIPTKTTATESVAKDSVNDNVKGKEKGKDTKIDSHKNDKDD